GGVEGEGRVLEFGELPGLAVEEARADGVRPRDRLEDADRPLRGDDPVRDGGEPLRAGVAGGHLRRSPFKRPRSFLAPQGPWIPRPTAVPLTRKPSPPGCRNTNEKSAPTIFPEPIAIVSCPTVRVPRSRSPSTA